MGLSPRWNIGRIIPWLGNDSLTSVMSALGGMRSTRITEWL